MSTSRNARRLQKKFNKKMLNPNLARAINERILTKRLQIEPKAYKRTGVGAYEIIFPRSIEFSFGVSTIAMVPGTHPHLRAEAMLRESDKDALDIECVQVKVYDWKTGEMTDDLWDGGNPLFVVVLVPIAIVMAEMGARA